MAFQDFLELAQEMIESQFLRKQELNRNTHTHTHFYDTLNPSLLGELLSLGLNHRMCS